MIVPSGKSVGIGGRVFVEGDEIPEKLFPSKKARDAVAEKLDKQVEVKSETETKTKAKADKK